MGISSPSTLLCFFVSISFFSYGTLAQAGYGYGFGQGHPWQSQRRFGGLVECRAERLAALEPLRQVRSEAGITEYFDENNEQLRCAGVAVKRQILEPNGLLLPRYSNAPTLIYVLQGRGTTGIMLPGCPETYQSSQQPEQYTEEDPSQSQRLRDEHQRIRRFREGDIIALPVGVAHWCYNDGDSPAVFIVASDTSNNANQLDPWHREFLLAGRQRGVQQSYRRVSGKHRPGSNILNGFNPDLLAEALGVSRELARRLQGQNDQRGEMVRVERGLHLLRPSRREEQQQQQQEEQEEEEERWDSRGRSDPSERSNGLDETLCTLRLKENIHDPSRADTYNPQAGRLTHLNSQKLPSLAIVQMSALRGVLHGNALLAPFWRINAHSLMYATGGRARVQVVAHHGRNVFDGELRRGQLLVIPQNYVVAQRAEHEGFEWISFKTHHNPLVNQIAGKNSVLRGLPVDVLANAYRISREEAQRLKFNRGQESGVFAPRYGRRPSRYNILEQ